MLKTSRKILFFGNERLATGTTTDLPVLKTLLSMNYEIRAIVIPSIKKKPYGTNHNLEIIDFSIKNNIPIIGFEDQQKIISMVKQENIKTAILIAFGKIIPLEVLNSFENGIINIHPSLLPKHRGPTPIESSILNGEKRTGLSIIKLIPKMDAGPIFIQKELDKNIDSLSKQEIATYLSLLAAELIRDKLDYIVANKVIPSPQNHQLSTYDKMISKSDAILDPISKTAIQLLNEIRAYYGWPRSKIIINKNEYIITSATIAKGVDTPGKLFFTKNDVGVYTKKDILVFKSILPTAKKEMNSKSFLAGYRSKLL